MREGTTATDLVLKVVAMLRAKGVVGKFVEFYGPGLDRLPLADRATIGNMAPEYGATCGFFPVDDETLRYLRQTGRPEATVALVEAYAKENGMWRGADYDPVYTDTLSLDMGIVPAISGPKRPQDHTPLDRAADGFFRVVADYRGEDESPEAGAMAAEGPAPDAPDAQIGARRGRRLCPARRLGGDRFDHVVHQHLEPLRDDRRGAGGAQGARPRPDRKPWVKTSLAPGSQVVSAYLEAAGLQEDLDAIGFNLVGYGCTTCIGNSGPLPEPISQAIHDNDLIAVSVLSGNRNFEGRISPDVRANYLASPPLVVAYAWRAT
jgi:aconitate hydratase